MTGLTDRQHVFVTEYLVNGFNGRQAYLKACPDVTVDTASVQAGRLLSNELVRNAIDKAKDKQHLKSIASKDNILLEMHEVRTKALNNDKLQTCLNASVEKAKIQGYYQNQDQDLTNYTQILQQLVINVDNSGDKQAEPDKNTITVKAEKADLSF